MQRRRCAHARLPARLPAPQRRPRVPRGRPGGAVSCAISSPRSTLHSLQAPLSSQEKSTPSECAGLKSTLRMAFAEASHLLGKGEARSGATRCPPATPHGWESRRAARRPDLPTSGFSHMCSQQRRPACRTAHRRSPRRFGRQHSPCTSQREGAAAASTAPASRARPPEPTTHVGPLPHLDAAVLATQRKQAAVAAEGHALDRADAGGGLFELACMRGRHWEGVQGVEWAPWLRSGASKAGCVVSSGLRSLAQPPAGSAPRSGGHARAALPSSGPHPATG